MSTPSLSLGSWPRRAARRAPERTAIVYEDRTLTYAQLYDRTTKFSNSLRGLGVRAGDRVAYLGSNHPSFLECLFATTALGGVFVPLNARCTSREIDEILVDSDPALLVFSDECAESVMGLSQVTRPQLMSVGGGIGDALNLEVALDMASADAIEEIVDMDEPCMIMYTSGTTGVPKGATLTHANITWNCTNVLVDLDINSDEVTVAAAPMFHAAALNMTCLPTLLKGGELILEPRFVPERIIDLVEERRVTLLFGVPTMFAALAQSPRWSDADLSSLRTLLCGGAPVPEALARTYLERDLLFIQGYGMTETSPGALCLAKHLASRRIGAAGVPHFFTDMRVVRSDLSDAGVNEPGELLVAGPNVMRGYWGTSQATEQAFTGGRWFRSGDIGVVDGDGLTTIVGRVKDVFISGGENVYPAEVEEVMCDHPAVSECAVVGIPDDRWGEVGVAFVVADGSTHVNPEELLDFLDGRLARYKIPKRIELVPSLPHTASGKVLKSALATVAVASEPEQ